MGRSAIISYYYSVEGKNNSNLFYVPIVDNSVTLNCGVVVSKQDNKLTKLGLYSDISDNSHYGNKFRYIMNHLTDQHYVHLYLPKNNNNSRHACNNTNNPDSVIKLNFEQTQRKQKIINDKQYLYVNLEDKDILLDDMAETYTIEIGLVKTNACLMKVDINLSSSQQSSIKLINFNLISDIKLSLDNEFLQNNGKCNVEIDVYLHDHIPDNAVLNGEFTISSNMLIGTEKDTLQSESILLTNEANITQTDKNSFRILLPIYIQYTQKYNNNDHLNVSCNFSLDTTDNSITFSKSYKVEFVNEINQQNMNNLFKIIVLLLLFIFSIVYILNVRANGFIYPQILIYLNSKLINIFGYLMEYFDFNFVDRNLQQLGMGLMAFGPTILSSQNINGYKSHQTSSIVHVSYKVIEKL